MHRFRITTLVENTASGRGTLGEHGLSFWIDTGSHRVLFDTGQTAEVLFHNASRLKIDLSTTDAIVLSHGHYDHTGGLARVLEHVHRPPLFLHPGALQQRFSRHRDGSVHEIGMPSVLTEQTLREKTDLRWTEEPSQIVPGLFVTGYIPRVNSFEDTGGSFYLDRACTQPDPIADDQAIYFDTTAGLVVLLGCAHAGVVNTLHHVRQHTGHRPVHAVIGGMHLLHASQDRMDQTVDVLRELDVQQLAPTHCTGFSATSRLWAEFPSACQPCSVATTFLNHAR